MTDLDDTIQKTHLIYIDKIYTNNKIDPELHKNIYKIQECNNQILLALKEDIKNIKNPIEYPLDTITNRKIGILSPRQLERRERIEEFNLKKN